MPKLTEKEKRDYMFNYYRKKRNWAKMSDVTKRKVDINILKKEFDETDKKFENLKDILAKYFPGVNADNELLKVTMKKLGKEKTMKAFEEVFSGWTGGKR
jgi:hypothetical protein